MSATSYTVALFGPGLQTNGGITPSGNGTLTIDPTASAVGFTGTVNGTDVSFTGAPATITACGSQQSVVVKQATVSSNGQNLLFSLSVSTSTLNVATVSLSGVGGVIFLAVEVLPPKVLIAGAVAGVSGAL